MDLRDIIQALLRRWRLFVLVCLPVGALALTGSLLGKKVYESKVTILPAMDQKDPAGGLAALAVGLQGVGMSLPGMGVTPSEIFVAILKSRVMADAVIAKFDLMRVLKIKTIERARKALEGRARINLSKEKVITVSVEGPDPKLNAEIANFYAEHLDVLNRTLAVTKAGATRRFVETRLAEAKKELTAAEEKLKAFQTKHRAVAVDLQSKALFEAGMGLEGQLRAQEVQLQVMRTSMADDHPEVARVRALIDGLRAQINRWESGPKQSSSRPRPSMDTLPDLIVQYGRLMRELKSAEAVHTMLLTQFEQAKLQEARDTPTVQVLDPAVPDLTILRPRPVRYTLLAMALPGGILAWFVLMRERRARVANGAAAKTAPAAPPSREPSEARSKAATTPS